MLGHDVGLNISTMGKQSCVWEESPSSCMILVVLLVTTATQDAKVRKVKKGKIFVVEENK
jgi:hypothetical protein